MEIFVSNLEEADENDILAFFGSGVVDVRLHRHFAFVELQSEDDVKRALSLDGCQLRGRPVSVQIAKPRR